MAAGFPAKTSFADGTALPASDLNDVTGTLNLIKPTAKGDLFVGSAANTYTKLSVGTDTYLLSASSTASTGLAWTVPPTGGVSLISNQSGSSISSLSWSSIPQTYKHLILEGSVSGGQTNYTTATITSTSLSGSYQGYLFESGTTPAVAYTNGGTSSWLVNRFGSSVGNGVGGFRAVFPNYSTTTYTKIIYGNGEGSNSQVASQPLPFGGSHTATSAISQLTITFNSSPAYASFSLYGMA